MLVETYLQAYCESFPTASLLAAKSWVGNCPLGCMQICKVKQQAPCLGKTQTIAVHYLFIRHRLVLRSAREKSRGHFQHFATGDGKTWQLIYRGLIRVSDYGT